LRILVCHTQVPFARGGAEVLVENLVDELRARGHETELVAIPFKWYPASSVMTQSLVWRLLDLDEVQGRPVDLVIATKFPSYVVRHPNKVVWLVHQFRQAYDLDRTELGEYGEEAFDRAARRAVHRLDRATLSEAQRLFAISENVASRLERSVGVEAEVLRPPPQPLEYRCDEYGDFVLSVGRLDRAKRVDLLLEAAAADGNLRVVIAGEGPDRGRLEELAGAHQLDGRVVFTGRLDDDALADQYAKCLAVFYAPIDEDMGYVPFEAFLAEKPVVTTRDAGGPLEVVEDRRTGLVCEPTPGAVAEALAWLRAHPDEARAQGQAGKGVAAQLTWDTTIGRLLGA
jgi:glycosyltransferase involved in cell wall biosynthesis